MAYRAAQRTILTWFLFIGVTMAPDADAQLCPQCIDAPCQTVCQNGSCTTQCVAQLDAACATFEGSHPEADFTNPQQCSQTELALFARDTTGQCLLCAATKGEIDDTVGETGQECDDLSGQAVAQCVAMLECELGIYQNQNDPPSVTPNAENPIYNYCGSYQYCPGNGPCAAQMVAGLPAGLSGAQVQASLFDVTQPTGMADALLNRLSDFECKGACSPIGPHVNLPYTTTLPAAPSAPALPAWGTASLAAALLAAFGLTGAMRQRARA